MTNANDRIFSLNAKRLALLTLPSWLRRPLVAAVVYSAVSPLGRLTGQLRRFRNECNELLEHNGQVCRLRALLNNQFDPELRRIAIEEDDWSPRRQWSRLSRRSQGRWLMTPRRSAGCAITINRRGIESTGTADFRVVAPAGLKNDQARLQALINRHKLAGKRFEITFIND